MGIMTGNAFPLLHGLMHNRVRRHLFLVRMTRETEFFLGRQKLDLARRSRRRMAGVARPALERLVGIALDEFADRGGVRIMTGRAVGFPVRHVSVRGLEPVTGQLVATGAEVPHRLQEVSGMGGTVRGVAEVALSLLDRDVHVPCLEAFFLFFVAGITECGAARGKSLLLVRPVRIVTSRALASGHGCMNGFALDDLAELGVTGKTQGLLA